VPPFLATGGPNRSSMLLALLMLVVGLLGGPLGTPLLDIDRNIVGGARVGSGASPSEGGAGDTELERGG